MPCLAFEVDYTEGIDDGHLSDLDADLLIYNQIPSDALPQASMIQTRRHDDQSRFMYFMKVSVDCAHA